MSYLDRVILFALLLGILLFAASLTECSNDDDGVNTTPQKYACKASDGNDAERHNLS
jgi:hypothetical protein